MCCQKADKEITTLITNQINISLSAKGQLIKRKKRRLKITGPPYFLENYQNCIKMTWRLPTPVTSGNKCRSRRPKIIISEQ